MRFDAWGWLDALAERGDRLRALKQRTTATLDAVLARVQAGAQVSQPELKRARDALAELYQAMADAHATPVSHEFPAADRADYYVESVKLTALEHRSYVLAPVTAEIRLSILPVLRARLAKAPTPWLACVTVQPALCAGDLALARDCYRRIADVPFLVKLVRRWCDEALMLAPERNRADVTRELAASLPEQPDLWNGPASVPADRHWILLTSFYPFLTFDPRLTLVPPGRIPAHRTQLEDDWGIRDAETAHDMLTWLYEEGHSAMLCEYLDGRRHPMPAAAFEHVDGVPPVPVLEGQRAALERYQARAWDLSRLVATARTAHAVGYLDEAATWKWLLLAGDEIRQTYPSWKAYGEDCILGARFFAQVNHVTPTLQIAMMRWLLDDDRSPWQRVAFGGPGFVPAPPEPVSSRRS